MPRPETTRRYDVAIIGGGINGAGLARDAAGRGFATFLCDQGDLGGGTSSATTKLIHGGLRYLEHYEFRMVAAALREREILLRMAAHIVQPLRFVLPDDAQERSPWLLRAGLMLYDRLGGRTSFPRSSRVRLDPHGYGAGLGDDRRRGFDYSDLWVDDARLVVINALDAHEKGATVRPRTRCIGARRDKDTWRIRLQPVAPRNDDELSPAGPDTPTEEPYEIEARVLVNATGPWVKSLLDHELGVSSPYAVRLVRGSHLVLPQVHAGAHALLLQNPDQRVVFLIPYEEKFTLLGTTEVAVDAPHGCVLCLAVDAPETPDEGEAHPLTAQLDPRIARPHRDRRAVSPWRDTKALHENAKRSSPFAISLQEAQYLCRAASHYTQQPLRPGAAVASYTGVRPLFDDGARDPSAVTRDYRLHIDAEGPPLLSVFGGKLTTYRRLAEDALGKLHHWLRGGPAWTEQHPLPGADFDDPTVQHYGSRLSEAFPQLDKHWVVRLARRHGTRSMAILAGVSSERDLGRHWGGGLYDRELEYLVDREWAMTGDDVLMRRTKCALHMTASERQRVRAYMVERMACRRRET